MNEESQVRCCYNILFHQPGNSVGSPLNQMHRQQLELTDDLLLQGHWRKEDAAAQRTRFNTLDNWGHNTPTPSKRKRNRKEKVKGSWPRTHTIHSVTSDFSPLNGTYVPNVDYITDHFVSNGESSDPFEISNSLKQVFPGAPALIIDICALHQGSRGY